MIGQVLDGYGQVMIFRDALEKAGVADRRRVAEEIRKMDTTTDAGRLFNGRLKWDETGRRAENRLVIIQWQSGKPRAVYPPDHATAKVAWASK